MDKPAVTTQNPVFGTHEGSPSPDRASELLLEKVVFCTFVPIPLTPIGHPRSRLS
jgi:hypothetical protein